MTAPYRIKRSRSHWLLLLSLCLSLSAQAQRCDSLRADSLFARLGEAADLPDEALAQLGRETAAAFRCLGDFRYWAAAAKRTAQLQYDRLAYSSSSATLDQAIGDTPDSLPLIRAGLHLYQGHLLGEMGLFADAASAYEQAHALNETAGKEPTPTEACYLYKPLGNAYTRLGSHEEAHIFLHKALSILQGDPNQRALVRNDIAILLRNQGRDAEADDTLRLALSDNTIGGETRALLESTQAVLYTEQGDPAAAAVIASAALKRIPSSSVYYPEILAIRAGAWGEMGRIAAAGQGYRQAIEAVALQQYKQPLQRLEQTPLLKPDRVIGKLYGEWGTLLIDHDPVQALACFDAGLRWVLPGFDAADPLPADSLFFAENTVAELLQGKAAALAAAAPRDLAQLARALAHYRAALAATTRLLDVQLYQADQQALGVWRYEISGEAVALAFARWEQTGDTLHLWEAFELAESSKAGLLAVRMQMLHDAQQRPAGLRAEEQRLRRDIALVERRLLALQEQGATAEVRLAAQEQLRALRLAYDARFALRTAAAPGLAFDRASLRARLGPDESLLSYRLADGQLFAFVLRRDLLAGRRLPLATDPDTAVAALLDALYLPFACDEAATMAQRRQAQRDADSLGHLLYRDWVAPLLPWLSDRWVLLPDGPLGKLPFQALLREPVGLSTPYMDKPYLIRRYDIGYAYSAGTWLSLCEPAPHTGRKTLLAIAPRYETTLSDVPANLRDDLGPLLHNEPEARTVQQQLGGDLLVAGDATLANFLRLAGTYQIIHFAGHGVLDTERPEASFLAFTAEEAEAAAGYLRRFDLYSLDLQADLVVLSACQTGLGTWIPGEGIGSLAWSFVQAGACSVVATLWSIDDKASGELMQRFYMGLKQGLPKQTALREAQLALLDCDRAPYYWAAYIQTGDGQALEMSAPVPWYLWVLGGLLVLALLGWGWKKMRPAK
ncbi:MAG: hypothetical protein OHK0039_05390 [Bacteroidia bacterium]